MAIPPALRGPRPLRYSVMFYRSCSGHGAEVVHAASGPDCSYRHDRLGARCGSAIAAHPPPDPGYWLEP